MRFYETPKIETLVILQNKDVITASPNAYDNDVADDEFVWQVGGEI